MMKKERILFLLLVVCALSLAIPTSAKTYEMTLLTVGESGEHQFGGTATAYLEVKPGSGRIFLDSFPLTKLDTQISTRYAKQIACDYLDMDTDCSRKDFFYTIRADSAIVGGPSASAPLTVLTIAALKGLDLRNDTVMTGTINSGGSVGPVGGIEQKALAAQEAGFKKVLVPKFSIPEENNETENSTENNPIIKSIRITTVRNETENRTEIIIIDNSTESNQTGQSNRTDAKPDTDISNLTIEVVGVSSLEEALSYFLNEDLSVDYGEIKVPEEYSKAMRDISDALCQKAYDLKTKVSLDEESLNRTLDFERKINSSLEENDYYSAASFCFNMGVMLRRINMQEVKEANPSRLEAIRQKALEAVRVLDDNLEQKNFTTLSEMESYIIVKERVIESQKMLEEMAGNITTDDLGYAVERYYSAVYWSKFFGIRGKPVKLDQEYLEEACVKKISEAEERLNYADLYLPSLIRATRDDLKESYSYAQEGNYEMCLFKASFAKAEANLLLSSLSIGTGKVSELAAEKLKAAEKLIAKESSRGFFPIMGYSYYEYANSLNANGDSISSLIFSEYTLELSNLEIYFPKNDLVLPMIDWKVVGLVAFAFLTGIIAGISTKVGIVKNKRKKSKRRK